MSSTENGLPSTTFGFTLGRPSVSVGRRRVSGLRAGRTTGEWEVSKEAGLAEETLQ